MLGWAQERDSLVVDRQRYLKYAGALGTLMIASDTSLNAIIQGVPHVANEIRLLKFEAKFCMIVYQNKAQNALKTLQRAEKEYSIAKKDPNLTVFGPLWAKAEKIKAVITKGST